MRFKREMFLTLILLLTIFSLSFASASEIGTYEQNTGELNSISISDIDPIDANLNNVNDIDEIETDDCLTNNGTQLLRSSNDEKDEDLEMLRAGNDVDILGASNDEPMLGDREPQGNTIQAVFEAIRLCSEDGGGTVYLNNQTYTVVWYPQPQVSSIRNVRVVGGTRNNPNLMSTFTTQGGADTVFGSMVLL